jgi:hypothetical protein
MTIVLPAYSALYVKDISGSGTMDGFLSEHGRGPISVTPEIIQNKRRTVNGTLRSYVVAYKHKFDVSWDNLPAGTSHTVDGYKGGNAIFNFYEDYYDTSFYLYVFNGNNVKKTTNFTTDLNNADRYTVVIDSFDYEITKRNVKMENTNTVTDLWQCSLTLEEV